MSKSKQRLIAVVLAAGKGTRIRGSMNKIFLPLHGKPIVIHTLEAFQESHIIDEIVLVASESDKPYVRQLLQQYWLPKVRRTVVGGTTRAESEYNAIRALRSEIETGAVRILLIHDAARPLVRRELMQDLVQGVQDVYGCVPTLRSADTIARITPAAEVASLYEQDEMHLAQTPQAFDARVLLSSYDKAWADGFVGTDTASVLERVGHAVRVIPGDEDNIKITTPDDIMKAEILLDFRRSGGAGASARS